MQYDKYFTIRWHKNMNQECFLKYCGKWPNEKMIWSSDNNKSELSLPVNQTDLHRSSKTPQMKIKKNVKLNT